MPLAASLLTLALLPILPLPLAASLLTLALLPILPLLLAVPLALPSAQLLGLPQAALCALVNDLLSFPMVHRDNYVTSGQALRDANNRRDIQNDLHALR